jgi:precorrin-2 dehydrogenase/sirohydrochlorin ferrochelatase
MIPLAIDPAGPRLGLAGAGAPALRRWEALRAAGAGESLTVFTGDPLLTAKAGAAARPGSPGAEDLARLHLLWIAGLPREDYLPLAAAARAARVLVNVEDVPELCDFHAVAELRRGDLLLTVSTGGQAPGLASLIRAQLAAWFPEVWAERVKETAACRRAWRAAGLGMAEIARRIATMAQERGWLNRRGMD